MFPLKHGNGFEFLATSFVLCCVRRAAASACV